MKKTIYLLLIAILGFISCKLEKKQPDFRDTKHFISGIVVGVFDGDTYNLLTSENKTIKVRMEGIDAPERGMPFYNVSKIYLSKLVFKKKIYVKKQGEDIYGRMLGFTYLENGTDINLEMLQAGMAWHFKRYNANENYAEAEEQARKDKLGLWKEKNPTPPWKYRRINRDNF